MKGKKLLICESHQIIDADHILSDQELRLIQLTLARHYQKDGIKADVFYEVPLTEYASWFNLKTDAAYHAVVNACKLLMSRTLTLKTALIDPTAPEKRKSTIHWVDRADYNADESKVVIRWHKDLVPLLNDFGAENPYSKYYLENTCRMKKVYSIRLFRVLNKWLKVGKFKRDLEEVKRLMGVEDAYDSYDNFRRKVLDKSIKEINDFSDLTVSYTTETKGRKVVGIMFDIERKKNEELV